jgi:hypothetical protein
MMRESLESLERFGLGMILFGGFSEVNHSILYDRPNAGTAIMAFGLILLLAGLVGTYLLVDMD